MCGIAGFIGRSSDRDVCAAEIRAMCDAIRHRGPDDEGIFVAPGLAIGMRRLSIIDLAGGHQPIANEDGTIQVVFNGEIYNYRELRRDLRAQGHRFQSSSDTEVLVHLYEDHGEDLVRFLRGMFAFAIWDGRRQRLLICRDRLGIKPLYYWEDGAKIAFASELKSLLALGDFPRDIDRRALADYLALGYVPEPLSIFAGVRKLEPGHLLSWQRDTGAAVRRYWSPIVEENDSISEADAVSEIQHLLAEAVRYRLIADVPLGAFLSGGIDSSAVVAEMARQMNRPVKTFSIGFHEAGYNEAPHAAAVAQALGTEHTELVVRPDVDDLIEEVVLSFDEPFSDSSAIPTFLVSALARSHVTVALSGDGGDELFGGYTRYLDLQQRNVAIPAPFRRLIATVARRLPLSAYGRNRLLELSRSPRGRYAGMVAHALRSDEGGVARPEIAAAGTGLDHLLDHWFSQAADRDMGTQSMLVDVMTYLPGDILTKVDRMSMAVSLEARVPILDHHLVEFALSLPVRLKIQNGEGKSVFRDAIRGRVPDIVLTRPKQGFAVPLDIWFRNELRHRLDDLRDTASPMYEFVQPSMVQHLMREHLSQRRNHTSTLWRLLVLNLWLDHHRGRAASHRAMPEVDRFLRRADSTHLGAAPASAPLPARA